MVRSLKFCYKNEKVSFLLLNWLDSVGHLGELKKLVVEFGFCLEYSVAVCFDN